MLCADAYIVARALGYSFNCQQEPGCSRTLIALFLLVLSSVISLHRDLYSSRCFLMDFFHCSLCSPFPRRVQSAL